MSLRDCCISPVCVSASAAWRGNLLDVADARPLTRMLHARGGVWAEELAAGRAFRVAVNQDIVALDAPLPDRPKSRFFPPVTGG